MEIKKIHGHTGFIPGGTNSGLYTFRDKMTLLVDPGRAPSRGKRICEVLEKNALKARYVYTTHEHLDHYQAFYGLWEKAPMVELFCFEEARPLVEHPHILHTIMYGAAPSRWLERKQEDGRKPCTISRSFSQGVEEINGKDFHVIPLPGHSIGSSALQTEDGVIFLGDAVLDRHIVEKYDIPYLNDVGSHLDSLDKIQELDFRWGLIAHAKGAYSREEILELVKLNRDVLEKYIAQSLELLTTPYTREDLMVDLLTLNDITCDYQTWHYDYSTVGAILTYLSDQRLIQQNSENNRIYYYKA